MRRNKFCSFIACLAKHEKIRNRITVFKLAKFDTKSATNFYYELIRQIATLMDIGAFDRDNPPAEVKISSSHRMILIAIQSGNARSHRKLAERTAEDIVSIRESEWKFINTLLDVLRYS